MTNQAWRSSKRFFRLEQQNHVTDLKEFFSAEIGKMKSEIKTEIENFKSELNTEMRTKFDLLEQFNIQTREEIKGVKKAIIDTGTDPTRSQKVFDKLRKLQKIHFQWELTVLRYFEPKSISNFECIKVISIVLQNHLKSDYVASKKI